MIRLPIFVVMILQIACADPISVNSIAVVDSDTIDVGSQRYRMVGHDTPEIATPRRHVTAD